MTANYETLKPSEVANMLGISRRTLDRWHALRIGPSRVTVQRTILYRQTAVDAWLTANETEPTRNFSSL